MSAGEHSIAESNTAHKTFGTAIHPLPFGGGLLAGRVKYCRLPDPVDAVNSTGCQIKTLVFQLHNRTTAPNLNMIVNCQFKTG